MKFETNNQTQSMFSFSSLTDIVMLLLIFFLLSSQFVVQTGVKVKLPGAKNNEESNVSKLIVSITEEKRIFIGTEETSVDMLPLKLTEKAQNPEEQNLIIRSDKNVEIDLVIKVIDAAKGLGISKFTIETEKESF